MSDEKIKCNPGYAKTLQGAINIAVLVCAAVCFILIQFSGEEGVYGTSAGNWASLLCIIGMCFNGIFLASGMLNMEIWACFKYADIGFSIGLSFCFATAAIDLSLKASGKSDALGGCAAVPAFFAMILYGIKAYKLIKPIYLFTYQIFTFLIQHQRGGEKFVYG